MSVLQNSVEGKIFIGKQHGKKGSKRDFLPEVEYRIICSVVFFFCAKSMSELRIWNAFI